MHRRWQRLKAWWMTRLWYAGMLGAIGPRSRIAPPLYVRHAERVAIGSGTEIGPHGRLEAHPPPQRSNKAPLLLIGDRVRIGGNVRLVVRASLVIGNGACIEDGCLVTDCEYGGAPDGPAYDRQPKTGRPTVIGEGAWIGAGSAVLAGSRIGRRAVILPGSVVDGEIPPFAVAAGAPAKVVRTLSARGRPRAEANPVIPATVGGGMPATENPSPARSSHAKQTLSVRQGQNDRQENRQGR